MEESHSSCERRRQRNLRLARKERTENSSQRKRSKAVLAIESYEFRTGDFHAFFAEDFFHATEEVRHLNGDSRFWGQKTSYDALALGNLDLVTVAEEIFHNREAVTEVANGGFLHVIHFSITIRSRQSQFIRICCLLKDAAGRNPYCSCIMRNSLAEQETKARLGRLLCLEFHTAGT